jgi:hypothetical protein
MERAPLADGDEVGLGSATFTFRLARSPKSTQSSDMSAPPTNPMRISDPSQDSQRA